MIPHVSGQARCLAPDLIGMGESGKPDLAYRLADHVRYLDAWFDAMSLNDAVLAGHDWGGTLAMVWAARHPGRVRGIAVAETFLRPLRSEELAPPVAGLFRAYRSSKGEQVVMEDNMVIEVNLAGGARELSAADLDVYRAPFLEPASRKPMLAWTREFPLDGEPADVVEVVLGCGRWMAGTPGVPKLIMAVEDGEDATQEILIRVVTRLASWRGKAELLTRAYRIGVNYLLNLRRKTPREAQRLSLDEFRADLADGLADADYQGPEASMLAEEVRLSCTHHRPRSTRS